MAVGPLGPDSARLFILGQVLDIERRAFGLLKMEIIGQNNIFIILKFFLIF